jgi:hypothetical protein
VNRSLRPGILKHVPAITSRRHLVVYTFHGDTVVSLTWANTGKVGRFRYRDVKSETVWKMGEYYDQVYWKINFSQCHLRGFQ